MKRSIRLRGMNGPFKGQTWDANELLRVGRLEALEIVLEDSSVSRYHAEVRATDRGWRVRDLGSTNGTRVNNQRIRRAVLMPNDQLSIANYKFRVYLGPDLPEPNGSVTHPTLR